MQLTWFSLCISSVMDLMNDDMEMFLKIDNAGGALEELRKNIDATQEVGALQGVLTHYSLYHSSMAWPHCSVSIAAMNE